MAKKSGRCFVKRKDFLPIGRPSIGSEEIKAVTENLKTGWITTGKKTQEFENRFKKYIGAKYAIALNSCTSALKLAMVALDVTEGDEVILSPLTFVSEANAIVQLGAKPVFADINKDTLNIDPLEIKKKITKKTKAIVVTHFAGQPCEMDKIKKIAKHNGSTIIEDAAHSLGSEYKGKKIGSDPSTISCFSFYPIKNITTAEGGMLTTGIKKIAEKVRLLSLHGLSKNAWSRYSKKGSWEYEVSVPGYKSNMPDILSVIGIEQLKKLERFNAKRRQIAKEYIRFLKDFPGVRIPDISEGIKHSWQIFPILLDPKKSKISRDGMIESLAKLNIGTSVHFKPVHLFKFYKNFLDQNTNDLSNTLEISQNIFSVPIFPEMRVSDVRYVVRSIKKIVKAL